MDIVTQKSKKRSDASQQYLNAYWPDLLRKTVPLFKDRADTILNALIRNADDQQWEQWVRDDLLIGDIFIILNEKQSWGPVAMLLLTDVSLFAKNLRAGKIVEASVRGVRPSNAVGRTVWFHLSRERERLLGGERAHPANQNDTDLDQLCGDVPTEDQLIARIDLIREGISPRDIPLMPSPTEVRAHMLRVCMERLRTERPEHHKAVAIKYNFFKGNGALTRYRQDTDAALARTWLSQCLRTAFPSYFPNKSRG